MMSDRKESSRSCAKMAAETSVAQCHFDYHLMVHDCTQAPPAAAELYFAFAAKQGRYKVDMGIASVQMCIGLSHYMPATSARLQNQSSKTASPNCIPGC